MKTKKTVSNHIAAHKLVKPAHTQTPKLLRQFDVVSAGKGVKPPFETPSDPHPFYKL